ncbi:MAG: hypothetical protein ACTSRR_13500 [Candidatus Heimdallarchaeaceae archaeon]
MKDNQKAQTHQRRGRPYIKNPITQLSLIEQSGMVLFHKSYVNTNVDEVLFSGFSAAIVIFARELGTKLNNIQMEQFKFYFDDSKTYFIVGGFHPKVWKRDIKKMIQEISEDLKAIELSEMIKKGVFYIPEEYQSLIIQRINELQIKYLLPKE